jgi:hypothetical protein
MKKIDTDNTFFEEIMSKSKLNVPFPDFDDKVMGLIERRSSKKASIMRDIKLSWIFFILGSTFGIIVTIILIRFPVLDGGIQLDKFTIFFLIIFSYLILTQLDSLREFYKPKE